MQKGKIAGSLISFETRETRVPRDFNSFTPKHPFHTADMVSNSFSRGTSIPQNASLARPTREPTPVTILPKSNSPFFQELVHMPESPLLPFNFFSLFQTTYHSSLQLKCDFFIPLNCNNNSLISDSFKYFYKQKQKKTPALIIEFKFILQNMIISLLNMIISAICAFVYLFTICRN